MRELVEFWESKDERDCVKYVNDLSKSDFIPFIGAGMSVPFGFSSWFDFLLETIDFYFDDGEEASELKALLNENKFLELASMINRKLGEGTIEERVRNSCAKSNYAAVKDDENYLFLMKKASIKTFVTTNFDSVIESYLKIPKEKIYLPSNMLATNDVVNALRFREHSVIKLHGSANNFDSIIVSDETFYTAYKNGNQPLLHFFDFLWNSSVLLFLGCSLKSDYMVEHIRELAFSDKSNWHYAILPYPDAELKSFRRNLATLKIRPIWYEKGKFHQINLILNAILNASVHPANTDSSTEYKEILNQIYKTTIRYRDKVRNGDIEGVNSETEILTSLVRKICYISEEFKYKNPQISNKLNAIVDQFNEYISLFTNFVIFSNTKDDKAELYARKAEDVFEKFVDLIIAQK